MTYNKTISLWELGRVYLLIGIMGFGPAVVAETRKRLVCQRKWLSEQDLLDGLALAQMLPGATFVSLTIYGGYKIRGAMGALVSFLAFILPSFFMMLFLSYVYFAYGSLPTVSVLFQGVKIAVAGLIVQAVLVIGKAALTDSMSILIALAAAGFLFIYPNVFLLLFLAAAAGILVYSNSLKQQDMAKSAVQASPGATVVYRKGRFLCLCLVAAIAFIVYDQPVLRQLGLVFFRMGAVLFGGGFSMIPFIQQEVVASYHWLTADEFLVGIALGQVTPGPITIMAAFVGYKVAAIKGAVAATFAIYLPSLLLVMAAASVHQEIRHKVWVRAAIKGMVSAFAGMMCFVAIGIVQHTVYGLGAVLLSAGVFLALQFGKFEPLWVVPGATLVYWVIQMLK